MVHKHRGILNNRNAIFSLCETSYEAQFSPDVTSFFVGWCIYENFSSLLPRPWQGVMESNSSLHFHSRWCLHVQPFRFLSYYPQQTKKKRVHIFVYYS